MYALFILNFFIHSCYVLYIRDNKNIKLFGERMRQIRKQYNLSQEELAYRANITISQVGRIERGVINTSVSTVFAIAKVLNIHPKEFFDFDFFNNPKENFKGK